MSGDFIDKIAEKLPAKQAYDDAVSPAAKQVGALGQDILKTLRLALAPFQYGAALQDRVANFIEESVRKVPEARRVTPPPQILGPVLEGIRYEPKDTPIDEMFSTLLSTSMDSKNLEKAHPSFPLIIRQLSRDEAVILKELKNQNFSVIETLDINPEAQQDHDKPYWINQQTEKELDFPTNKLFLPKNFPFYTEHLFHLGLACFSDARRAEPIIDASGIQTGTRKFREFRLMPLGRSIVEACIRNSVEST